MSNIVFEDLKKHLGSFLLKEKKAKTHVHDWIIVKSNVRFRDENSNEFIIDFYRCECGAGGRVKTPKSEYEKGNKVLGITEPLRSFAYSNMPCSHIGEGTSEDNPLIYPEIIFDSWDELNKNLIELLNIQIPEPIIVGNVKSEDIKVIPLMTPGFIGKQPGDKSIGDKMPNTNVEDEEINVSDREIDALMNPLGFTWQEENAQYENGDQIVSGDFASRMTLKLKQAAARERKAVELESLETGKYVASQIINGVSAQDLYSAFCKSVAELTSTKDNS